MEERRPDGAAGVERVKSAYRSSSNRPETISERGYTLNIFKVSMYSNPTAPLVRHRDGFSGWNLVLSINCISVWRGGSVTESPDVYQMDFVLEVCEQSALPN